MAEAQKATSTVFCRARSRNFQGFLAVMVFDGDLGMWRSDVMNPAELRDPAFCGRQIGKTWRERRLVHLH